MQQAAVMCSMNGEVADSYMGLFWCVWQMLKKQVVVLELDMCAVTTDFVLICHWNHFLAGFFYFRICANSLVYYFYCYGSTGIYSLLFTYSYEAVSCWILLRYLNLISRAANDSNISCTWTWNRVHLCNLTWTWHHFLKSQRSIHVETQAGSGKCDMNFLQLWSYST